VNRAAPASWVLAVALAIGAVAIGGGTPLSPRQIADNTRAAADNAARAAHNTGLMVSDSESLATIAANARSQYQTSQRLLETQLAMESSSRSGADRSRALHDRLRRIGAELASLLVRLRSLSEYSDDTTANTSEATVAASSLDAAVGRLAERFEQVVRESRELNRKARGYDRVSP
jgi:hypothetical protein